MTWRWSDVPGWLRGYVTGVLAAMWFVWFGGAPPSLLYVIVLTAMFATLPTLCGLGRRLRGRMEGEG